MCILRIDCPDSKDHVIWFLSRVDVDPSCLDVKFSDCYYYCRLLRDDNSANDCPPLTGWNIPKVPPGIVIARQPHFRWSQKGIMPMNWVKLLNIDLNTSCFYIL